MCSSLIVLVDSVRHRKPTAATQHHLPTSIFTLLRSSRLHHEPVVTAPPTNSPTPRAALVTSRVFLAAATAPRTSHSSHHKLAHQASPSTASQTTLRAACCPSRRLVPYPPPRLVPSTVCYPSRHRIRRPLWKTFPFLNSTARVRKQNQTSFSLLLRSYTLHFISVFDPCHYNSARALTHCVDDYVRHRKLTAATQHYRPTPIFTLLRSSRPHHELVATVPPTNSPTSRAALVTSRVVLPAAAEPRTSRYCITS
ncbi:hypothetical protein ACSQ67_008569 [Phaseolus vulgaris]